MLAIGIVCFVVFYLIIIKTGISDDRPSLVIWPIIIAFFYLVFLLSSYAK